MKYTAVISSKAEEAAKILSDKFDLILLPADADIAQPVSCHADMILFELGDYAVMPMSYMKRYPHIAEELSRLTGKTVIADSSDRGAVYPRDVGLNVLVSQGVAFSNCAVTSPCVKELIIRSELCHVNVKQGYAACSCLAFGNALVTADRGMAAVAEEQGLDVLLISNDGIILPGYDVGFIGGASGVCEKEIYFLGNIDCHADAKKIRAFIEKHGYGCISLYDGPLTDFGGIKFIKNSPHGSDRSA